MHDDRIEDHDRGLAFDLATISAQSIARRRALAWFASAGATALAAGCGGGSGGSTATASSDSTSTSSSSSSTSSSSGRRGRTADLYTVGIAA